MWTEPSFRALYVEHYRLVRTRVLRWGVAARDAEDVAQEVFLAVARGLDRYDPARPFKPWLLTIAFRKARDHLALARNRDRLTRTGAVDRQADRSSPEELAAAEADLALVERAIAELPEELRRVLVLADVEEGRWADVAARLDLPASTVQSALRRARRDLARLLRLRGRPTETRVSVPSSRGARAAAPAAG